MDEGEFDAIILAAAGLKRGGLGVSESVYVCVCVCVCMCVRQSVCV